MGHCTTDTYNRERCSLVVELGHIVRLVHVEVDLEGFTGGAHDQVIRPVIVHLNLRVQQNRHQETIFVLIVGIEGVLPDVLHENHLRLFRLLVDQLYRSQ